MDENATNPTHKAATETEALLHWLDDAISPRDTPLLDRLREIMYDEDPIDPYDLAEDDKLLGLDTDADA